MKKANYTSETVRTITVKDAGMTERYVMKSIDDTNRFAKKLVKELQGGDVLALSGNLGSGKTTFSQFLAKALGIKDQITSPTFVLMKIYVLPSPINSITQLCHIDAYRMGSSVELETIGGHEYIEAPDTLTVIEWPERVQGLIPQNAIWISFALDDTV